MDQYLSLIHIFKDVTVFPQVSHIREPSDEILKILFWQCVHSGMVVSLQASHIDKKQYDVSRGNDEFNTIVEISIG